MDRPYWRDRLLYPLGALMLAVAVTALIVALSSDVDASAITGPGCGLLMLSAAVIGLVDALRPRSSQ